MEITYLKTWIFYAIIFRQLVDGAEEYFIAPTAWNYIKSLGQNMVFFGLVMSAFQISALASSPIIGRLADKFGDPRAIISISLFLKFAGYVIYTIPVSAYFPLAGRFIAGLSDGSIGVYFGQVVLYTPKKYRTQTFIIMDGVFTFGALFGPTVGVFLTFNTNILGWKINAGNSPGIVLAMLCFRQFFVSLWFPKEFGTAKVSDDDDMKSDSGDDVRDTDNWSVKPKYASLSTVSLLFHLVILGIFCSTVVTFYVPLLAHEHFHLKLTHVKLLFLANSLFSFTLFLSFYIAAKYYDETRLSIVLMIMQVSAISLLTCIAFSWDNALGVRGGYILLAYICLGMHFYSFSLCCSLLSKVTHPKVAAFYQASSVAALNFGYLLSRLISSYIFTQRSLLLFCLAQLLCWTFGAVWFALEFPNLREKMKD